MRSIIGYIIIPIIGFMIGTIFGFIICSLVSNNVDKSVEDLEQIEYLKNIKR